MTFKTILSFNVLSKRRLDKTERCFDKFFRRFIFLDWRFVGMKREYAVRKILVAFVERLLNNLFRLKNFGIFAICFMEAAI